MPAYQEEFALAIERTCSHNLALPPIQPVSPQRWMTESAIARFHNLLLPALFPKLAAEDLSEKCLTVHKKMAPVISKWLGCEAVYTLGWIDDIIPGGLYRGFDDAFIQEAVLLGHKGNKLHAHAWLTLPSMEIIDLTLLTTIGVLKHRPSWLMHYILKHADQVTGMTYKPMLVGTGFLTRAKIKVD